MARQKNDGKGRLGGRAKGTPNKATLELKTWVSFILDDGRDRFIESLMQLDPVEYIRVFTGLLNYVLPKQSPISQNPANEGGNTSLNIIVHNEEEAELLRKLQGK